MSYEVLHNDTQYVGQEIFLPQWNSTLQGGILQVCREICFSLNIFSFNNMKRDWAKVMKKKEICILRNTFLQAHNFTGWSRYKAL